MKKTEDGQISSVPCKQRRKIKKEGLNIWTNDETGQDKKRIMNDEF